MLTAQTCRGMAAAFFFFFFPFPPWICTQKSLALRQVFGILQMMVGTGSTSARDVTASELSKRHLKLGCTWHPCLTPCGCHGLGIILFYCWRNPKFAYWRCSQSADRAMWLSSMHVSPSWESV